MEFCLTMFASLQLDQVELTLPRGSTAESAKVEKTYIIYNFLLSVKLKICMRMRDEYL